MRSHSTKSLCISRSAALTQQRAHDALAVAKALLSGTDNCPVPSQHFNVVRDAIKPYQKPQQQRKVQLQLTLRELSQFAQRTIPNDHMEGGSLSTVTFGSVVAPLLDVAAVLESSARAYLDKIITCVPSARGIATNLDKHSVLRIWLYQEGAECRTHCDPGLATALLQGSQSGLEVTFDEVAPFRLASGDYRSTKRRSALDGDDQSISCDDVIWTPVEELVRSSSLSSSGASTEYEPVLIMAGTQTQVLTSHRIRGVPHRVVNVGPNASCSAAPRVNIILELRPEFPKQWYGFEPVDSEMRSLDSFIHKH